jgi:pilus assembly protein Flp/PilA
MSKFVSRFMKDESGATAIEYGLIAALIAVVLIAILGAVGGALNTKFGEVNTALGGAAPK